MDGNLAMDHISDQTEKESSDVLARHIKAKGEFCDIGHERCGALNEYGTRRFKCNAFNELLYVRQGQFPLRCSDCLKEKPI